MKERPILFSGPMVRAILSGQKTQTRRIMREQVCDPGIVQIAGPGYCEIVNEHGVQIPGFHCPYGQPGDRLWVREAWCASSFYDSCAPREIDPGAGLRYPADGPSIGCRTRPSIHMPRWASRITLEITGVRVERLQDISEDDAQAEGVRHSVDGGDTAREGFRNVWESINGLGAWDANPWVWVVEFRGVEP